MTCTRRLVETGRLFVLSLAVALVATGCGPGGSPQGGDDSRLAETRSALSLGDTFLAGEHVTPELEGCRYSSGLTLPNGAGAYICPDANYTNGNLGKGWNELDLVPHRLTTQLGNQAAATTDYMVYIAADYQTGGRVGYDFISIPVLDVAKSDTSCSVDASPEGTLGSAGSPFGGGTDVVRYRMLQIHQAKGSTCVFDYYQRLALGSHLYPGSSLQSYLAVQDGLSGSKKTISIPVNEIQPQSISKDETATQGADYQWDVTKTPTPATLTFDDTCDPDKAKSQQVEIRIEWTKKPAVFGAVNVIAHVYATNPSARVITVDVTDVMYAGLAQTTVLDSLSSGPIDLSANTASQLVLTHEYLATDPTLTNINDVATATYTDKVTGIAVPGTTEATASTSVQVTFLDASAIVNDVESIAGAGLSFSADSFSPDVGAFDGGYVAGTQTSAAVSWTSSSQTGNGNVSFQKTVFVESGTEVSGVLHDIATLTGSDGFDASATADVNINASAQIRLTIDKGIEPVPTTGARTFNFVVKDGNGDQVGDPIPITITAPSASATAEVKLPPGAYTIAEDPATLPAGCAAAAPQELNLALPGCTKTVSFMNVCFQDLTVTKTATPSFKRTYAWTVEKLVDRTRLNIAEGGNATFNYTVEVKSDAGTDSDWKLEGVVTVANPNPFPISGVSLSDSLAGCTLSQTSVDLPALGSVPVPYSCTFSSGSAGDNVATATWATYGSTTATGSASFAFTTPTTVVNDVVNVTDSYAGNLGTVTAPGSQTFTYSRTIPGVAGRCTAHDNTATYVTDDTGATGSSSQTVTVCVGKDPTVTKTATPTFTRAYAWGIEKLVDQTRINIAQGGLATFDYTVNVTHDAGTDSAWKVDGTITVINPNDWEAIVIDVTDGAPGGTCTVTGGTGVTLAASAQMTFPYSCSFASGGSGTNTATASWDKVAYATPGGSASGTAGFSFATPTTIVNGSASITDTLGGSLGIVSHDDPSPKSFTYAHSFAGVGGTCTSYDNTATFVTSTDGATGSSSQTVEVCVGLDPTVSKTATPSFTRTYRWDIAKAVDQTKVYIAAGGTATFVYTVNVAHDAGTDSLWAVNGTIHLANPNDWEAITVNLADAVDNGGTCSLTPVVTVPASGTMDVPYSCDWASAPFTAGGTNHATATWSAAEFFTPSGEANGQAQFSFTTPTSLVNDNVTVTDTLGGTLGIVSYAETSPKPFTYSRSFAGVGGACTSYDNTASFVTDDTGASGSASQLVTVCAALDPIITKTAETSFMREYFWAIQKQVAPTWQQVLGTEAILSYLVGVQETGFTDSAWVVTGTVTVVNPNQFGDATLLLTALEDSLSTGGLCTTDFADYPLPAASSATFSYICAPPSGDQGTNTATVTYGALFQTPHTSAAASADYAFVTPTVEINKTVNIVDSFNGGAPDALGSVTATPDQLVSAAFPYSRTVTVVPNTCETFDNTATIVETDQSASASATACGPTLLSLVKTVQGAAPSETHSFTFQLRQGASVFAEGSMLQQADANASNGGNVSFSATLMGGEHYQFCEWVMPGWNTTLGNYGTLFVPNSVVPPSLPNPNVNNMTVCVDFVPTAGQLVTFTVDNTPPPGGRALTIGFWKNWASCSNSKGMGQKPMLDQTLAASMPDGIQIGLVTLVGDAGEPNVAPDCMEAVNLLNKSTIDGRKKMASDPAFNLAAQAARGAAELRGGANPCGLMLTAAASAQSLWSRSSSTA